jgi:outer membrane receptor protein involved in Fe transport
MVRLARLVSAAATCALVLGVSSEVYAQKITGDISGTITDATGAAMPGATVSAVCAATGLTRGALASSAGGYELRELPICVYRLSVTMQGFKTTSRDVQVAVSTMTKADFKLQIGDKSEEVTVEGAAPTIEFSDKLNNYVDKKRIDDLPLNGRDFNSLLGITPGVQRAPGGGFLAVNISGQRNTSANYMVDGISNNDPYYGDSVLNQTGILGIPATLVPMDAIAEFTVQQTPGAEFGVKGGAGINVVMKSGTNEFHGSGYYYRHDDWMDAKNYFVERDGGDKTPLENQQFGATLGGPIIKDKTFFFAYYEGQRLATQNPYRAFVPTPAQVAEARARIRNAGLQPNPAGEALFAFFPVDPSGEVTVGGTTTNHMDTWSLKLDHRLNDRNQISARYFWGKSLQSAPAATGSNQLTPAGDNPPDMFNSIAPSRVDLAGLTWTSSLGSNKILETRVGYSSFGQIIDINNKIDPRNLGIDTGPLASEDFGVPAVYYFSSFGYIGGIGGYPITTDPNATLDVSSSLTWNKGRNTLKFGGNFQRSTSYSFRNRARTSFDVNQSGDPVDGIVGMLLGRFAAADRSFGDTKRHFWRNSFGTFASDDIKLSPRFTLTLGLRYDYSTAIGDRDDQGSNFFPDRGLVDIGQGIDSLYETDRNNIGPRVGFSWDVSGTGRTAVRGGYALTYDIPNFGTITAPQVTFYGSRAGAFTQVNQGVFGVGLAGDLAVPPDDPGATCVDPITGLGNYVCVTPGRPIFGPSPVGSPPFNAVSVVSPLKTPQFHLYHLTLQHEVFKNNVATISYVGQRGRNLIANRDLNASPIGSDPDQSHRPFASRYPDLRHITQITNDSKSWYDSVQLSWRQSDWKGFNSQYNLTWGDCRDLSSANRLASDRTAFPQSSNPYDISKNKGPCDHDVTLNLNASAIYSFPKMGNSRMGEGWEIATVFAALGGRPETPDISSLDNSGQDVHAIRANCSSTDVRYNTRDPDRYIANPEIFSVPAPGTLGTCGRNMLRGPGLAQWDISLVKMTRITDRVKLQFRWEIFNILNRANFGILSMVTNVRSDQFGTLSSTPDVDSGNPVIAQGGPRSMQFALKLLF